MVFPKHSLPPMPVPPPPLKRRHIYFLLSSRRLWLKVPNSRLALHGLAPPNSRLCTIFPSKSRFMHLCHAPLDTRLASPLLCQPLNSWFALHGLRAFEQP